MTTVIRRPSHQKTLSDVPVKVLPTFILESTQRQKRVDFI
jgi:hypothetical protein